MVAAQRTKNKQQHNHRWTSRQPQPRKRQKPPTLPIQNFAVDKEAIVTHSTGLQVYSERYDHCRRHVWYHILRFFFLLTCASALSVFACCSNGFLPLPLPLPMPASFPRAASNVSGRGVTAASSADLTAAAAAWTNDVPDRTAVPTTKAQAENIFIMAILSMMMDTMLRIRLVFFFLFLVRSLYFIV